MLKIEDTTKEQRDRLAQDLSIAYATADVNRYADERQALTTMFGELVGQTPLAAVNALWDMTGDSVTPGVLRIRLSHMLDDEAEVYRSKLGRETDLAALGLDGDHKF